MARYARTPPSALAHVFHVKRLTVFALFRLQAFALDAFLGFLLRAAVLLRLRGGLGFAPRPFGGHFGFVFGVEALAQLAIDFARLGFDAAHGLELVFLGLLGVLLATADQELVPAGLAGSGELGLGLLAHDVGLGAQGRHALLDQLLFLAAERHLAVGPGQAGPTNRQQQQ